VDFSHYDTRPVELAVDLVNTDQRSIGGVDRLASVGDVRSFLEPFGDLVDPGVPPAADGDLEAIRRLRSDLRAVFAAEDATEAAGVINELLEVNVATPRLSTHSGNPHLHFEPLDSSMSQWLAVLTAMGLAVVIAEHGVGRFGVCDSDTCDDVFVDTSRNRSRRNCSTTCTTRDNVAAYRRRKSTSQRVDE
jgi:predicted RNA-binding Zn ribbon-like protein